MLFIYVITNFASFKFFIAKFIFISLKLLILTYHALIIFYYIYILTIFNLTKHTINKFKFYC